jgi:PPOX class probable F420-dependent enzyme
MDIAVAQQFLREHENAVLTTWRRDGRVQMSPVTVGLDGAGRAIISSNETTYKVRNLRRDPRAVLCVFVEALRGPWVQMEGTAEIVTLPDAMEARQNNLSISLLNVLRLALCRTQQARPLQQSFSF